MTMPDTTVQPLGQHVADQSSMQKVVMLVTTVALDDVPDVDIGCFGLVNRNPVSYCTVTGWL